MKTSIFGFFCCQRAFWVIGWLSRNHIFRMWFLVQEKSWEDPSCPSLLSILTALPTLALFITSRIASQWKYFLAPERLHCWICLSHSNFASNFHLFISYWCKVGLKNLQSNLTVSVLCDTLRVLRLDTYFWLNCFTFIFTTINIVDCQSRYENYVKKLCMTNIFLPFATIIHVSQS